MFQQYVCTRKLRILNVGIIIPSTPVVHDYSVSADCSDLENEVMSGDS
jgi:hypothetical protein